MIRQTNYQDQNKSSSNIICSFTKEGESKIEVIGIDPTRTPTKEKLHEKRKRSHSLLKDKGHSSKKAYELSNISSSMNSLDSSEKTKSPQKTKVSKIKTLKQSTLEKQSISSSSEI